MPHQQMTDCVQVVLEDLGAPTLIVDGCGEITASNAAARSLLQRADRSITGHLSSVLPEASGLLTTSLPPLDLPGGLKGWSTTADLECDGRRIDIEVMITACSHEEGAVVSLRDISAETEAHETLVNAFNEVERFNRMSIGRELRMVELKREINELLEASGGTERYEVPQ